MDASLTDSSVKGQYVTAEMNYITVGTPFITAYAYIGGPLIFVILKHKTVSWLVVGSSTFRLFNAKSCLYIKM